MVKEIVRILNNELVERRARSHQQRGGTPFAASCPAGALPGGSNSSRIASHHRNVETSDVDSQFERVGGNDTKQPPFTQVALNLAPLKRQIAAPVTTDDFRSDRAPGKIFLEVSHQDFRCQT